MMNSYERLVQNTRQGWAKKLGHLSGDEKKKYGDRIKYELGVIQKLKFSDYFLIIQDIIDWARAQGIRVGPGRGSSAGSLVSFCLDITRVDPIVHDLHFERFLNENRVNPPDIDIDFQDTRRAEVLHYIVTRYGRSKAAAIITFSYSQAKGIIKDLCKVFEIPLNVADKITKVIWDNDLRVEMKQSRNKVLRKFVEEYPALFEHALKLQGVIRHTSMHAAGVVISDTDLTELLPVGLSKKEVVIQWDKDDVEGSGFLKIDILGLNALTTIEETLQLIREAGKEINFDLDNLPLDDQNIFKLFRKGRTAGLFQFETHGQTETMRKVQPHEFYELADVNALYRPGAKEAIPLYVGGKTGEIEVDCIHPSLEHILLHTYGVILYQEQTTAIVMELAGMSAPDADVIRKQISKSRSIEESRAKFMEGCKKNGVDESLAKMVFDIIKQGENYAFNKSHAVSYAMVAYQMAFLKIYYPVEFMTAVLRRNVKYADKWEKYEKVFRRDVKIFGWDINQSKATYSMNEDGIRRGFFSIPDVGLSVAQHIEEKQPYQSFSDFFSKVKKNIIRTNAIRALLQAGAFDSLGEDADEILSMLSKGSNQFGKMVQSRGLF